MKNLLINLEVILLQNHLDTDFLKSLFQPFTLGKLSLANRFVMAPMTRGFSPNGVPGADVAAYYRRRAENGVGLIVTEGTLINHPAASGDPNWPNFHGESLDGWRKVVNEVHAAGGKIVPQIWHIGTTRKVGSLPNPESLPIGPSGITASGEVVSEPLTVAQIEAVVGAYAQAAADAKRLGFDGVEIHGAHGYLIDQFFWEKTNLRTDKYGGDLVKRTRFAVEVIKACRNAVGPDFPIIFRFSQWKGADYTAKLAKKAAELEQLLLPLADAGVDIFHCSTRKYWEPEFADSDLNLAGWAKKITNKPTITVGSVGIDTVFHSSAPEVKATFEANMKGLMKGIEQEEFDLVAVGRAILQDPAWVKKLQEGNITELLAYNAEATRTLK